MSTSSVPADSTALGTRDHQALVRAIYRTIAYGDLFDQAVVEADVARYLELQATRDEIRATLRSRAGLDWMRHGDLYCLPGRQHLIPLTMMRRRDSQTHWCRARRWAHVMSHVPLVRMVAVTGSLAMHNMGPTSDLDFLVVTAPRRVWLTRLMLVALVRVARLFGDLLCPNYVLSLDVLELDDRSYFTARELAQMVPVFGLAVYGRMMELNRWAKDYLPLVSSPPTETQELRLSRPAFAVRSVLEWLLGTRLGDRLERWEQRKKIAELKRLPGADLPSVVLTSDQCKGHFSSTHRALAEHRSWLPS